MGKPYICPICDGTGEVNSDWYYHNTYGGSTVVTYETCKTCKGEGIVWNPYEAGT